MKLNESEYFEIDVDISGDLDKGTKQTWSQSMEQHYPGSSPEIRNLKVLWRGMDITDKLTPKERQDFENRLLVDLSNEDMYE